MKGRIAFCSKDGGDCSHTRGVLGSGPETINNRAQEEGVVSVDHLGDLIGHRPWGKALGREHDQLLDVAIQLAGSAVQGVVIVNPLPVGQSNSNTPQPLVLGCGKSPGGRGWLSTRAPKPAPINDPSGVIPVPCRPIHPTRSPVAGEKRPFHALA